MTLAKKSFSGGSMAWIAVADCPAADRQLTKSQSCRNRSTTLPPTTDFTPHGKWIFGIVSHPLYEGPTVLRLSTRAGKTGGRTDSIPHPKRTFAAAPHTRPWHAPIPQRVFNFASRHPAKAL